jgi:hypothetical protein
VAQFGQFRVIMAVVSATAPTSFGVIKVGGSWVVGPVVGMMNSPGGGGRYAGSGRSFITCSWGCWAGAFIG